MGPRHPRVKFAYPVSETLRSATERDPKAANIELQQRAGKLIALRFQGGAYSTSAASCSVAMGQP